MSHDVCINLNLCILLIQPQPSFFNYNYNKHMRFYVIFRPREWNCELPEPKTTLTANNRNVYPRYASIRWLCACYKLVVSLFFSPLSPWRRCTRREKHIPVTRLSASLLTSWLFPDKYSRPLDSTPLSSRIMANYQEAVCWKDAARNYICLQTVLRFKHVLWKKKKERRGKKSYLQRHNGSKEPKLPSKNHVTVEKCLSHD